MTISHPRIEVKEAAAGWFGAREDAQLPVRRVAPGSAPADTNEAPLFTSDRKTWMRRLRNAALDVAVILAAMTAVPVLFVATSKSEDWRSSMVVDNTREKVAVTEGVRSLRVPVDPAITSLEAGRAFSALLGSRGSSNVFPMISVQGAQRTWPTLQMPPTLFPTARPNEQKSVPGVQSILQAAAHGLSAEEMDYLRKIATAPAWREFDIVAHAKSMDVIGARFVLPFTPNASIRDLPIGSFSATKDLAYAAVSRAAYHLALGQRDSAETILKSIVSFGFNMADNGTGLIDQLVGRVIVEIGRNGLENFYTVTHDPRVVSVQRPDGVDAAAMSAVPVHLPPSHPQSIDEMRRELIARATNPSEIQGIRWASLELLQTSVCTNVRELLFGPRAEVSDAFRRAKADLARFPSQQALIDLIERSPETDPIAAVGYSSPLRRFVYGTSAIAGTVLHNPRLAACMWHVTEGKPGF